MKLQDILSIYNESIKGYEERAHECGVAGEYGMHEEMQREITKTKEVMVYISKNYHQSQTIYNMQLEQLKNEIDKKFGLGTNKEIKNLLETHKKDLEKEKKELENKISMIDKIK